MTRSECPYAMGITPETDEDRWMRAYRKFQSFRLDHSLSVSHFFDLINDSGTTMLCTRAFSKNTISLIHVITAPEMLAWTRQMQTTAKKHGFISPEDLMLSAKAYKTTIDNTRKQPLPRCAEKGNPKYYSHFAESECTAECPSLALMQAACACPGSKRRPSQLTLILRWMMHHRVLAHASQPKLLDLCRKVQLLTVDRDTKVVVQKSPGDAFYMILAGRVAVEVDGVLVSSLREGMTFGERALDSDSSRAATVRTITDCYFMVIQASDYKSITISARAVLNVELMNFVSHHCAPFQKLSYPDLYQAARCMHVVHVQGRQQIFQEGELVKGLYVVMAGRVHLARRVTPVEVVQENFLIPSLRNEHVKPFNIVVDQEDLGPGAVFGEECLREGGCSVNSATSVDACQLIFISSCDLNMLQDSTKKVIIEQTKRLHVDNLSLMLTHQQQLKKKMVLRTFRAAAMRPIVIHRFTKSPLQRKVNIAERRRSSSRGGARSRAGARGSVGFLEELAEQDQAELTARSSNGRARPLPPISCTPPRKSVTIVLPSAALKTA